MALANAGNPLAGLGGSFWANAGSSETRKVGTLDRAMLLERTVVSKFRWKLSRWPFQKTVAIALDSVQCRMMAIIMKTTRMSHETIDVFCRRRNREARNVCEAAGMWSELWANRVVHWHQHVARGVRHNHFCHPIMINKNQHWLQMQRVQWVYSNGSSSRNTMLAGRTGTRCNIGRPQVRWDSGVELAQEVLKSKRLTQKGGKVMSISSRIKNALVAITQSVQRMSDT